MLLGSLLIGVLSRMNAGGLKGGPSFSFSEVLKKAKERVGERADAGAKVKDIAPSWELVE